MLRVIPNARSVAPTLQRLAAVDDQGAAAYVAGVCGEQEHDRVDNVVGAGRSTQRDAALSFRWHRLAIFVVGHQTHGNGVDPDPVRTAGQCQRARQRQQASLTRAVTSRPACVSQPASTEARKTIAASPPLINGITCSHQHATVDQVADRRVLALLAGPGTVRTRKPLTA